MPGVLCEHCTGVCCRYIALPIETPETRAEFDDVRWYLLHEGISVFVEQGDWYLCVSTVCRHLQPDNRCGIYATRPAICRKYSSEQCDYHSGDYGWEQHFTCPEHLEAYARTWLAGNKDSEKAKKPDNGRNCNFHMNSTKLKNIRTLAGRAARPGRAATAPPAATDGAGRPLPVLGSPS